MQLNPDATFDSLFLASRLQTQNGSFSAPEIHLFAYLSCLLWLYRSHVVSDWGYPFVGTELGAPFSQEIDLSVKELLERGHLYRLHDRLYMTEQAEQRLDAFSRLELNRERMECMEAACSSISAFSIGMVRSALTQEPELCRAAALPANRSLLTDSAKPQLYAQFDALRNAISSRSEDLRLPAVIWITALHRSSETSPIEA